MAAKSCKRPKLIVFDLDYTLWPFWIDTHVRPPLKKDKNGTIVDSSGHKIQFFPEVPEILERLHSEGYMLGVASRTEWPQGAKQLLHFLDWDKYFRFKEIYPGKKTSHFQRLKERSDIPYSEMLFFDDEQRNIIDLRALGVTSFLVRDGLNNEVLESGLKYFRNPTS